jgi:hypothetical protein
MSTQTTISVDKQHLERFKTLKTKRERNLGFQLSFKAFFQDMMNAYEERLEEKEDPRLQ